ncbi:hypothetical protein K450DRAFT_267457 [Umbelopsis ramanniana AG]|uniref:Uncharacterized protein n=1 Tax=Umbelopsis ramanniana AG TaxID=1314678 RepID=A0AAD5EKS6_UMBRA|nr:uncharacterized protein K450DRAFT_267457 [Umbelopsis ramanniana AG]KAI8584801.1 hypothetical protein K450DRAFT_267457 [Umbelopsis ramanniana AG]
MPLSIQRKDLSGLTVIVTGANIGIGLETARMLSEMGAQVTIACRNANKAETAAEDIEKTTGKKPHVASLDLSNFDSTVAFVDEFKANHDRLDILVNNAGVVSSSKGEDGMSKNGFEIDFQVNHLSQFLLTNRLLPLITNAAQNKINNFTPRVVTVGSNAATIGKIDYSYVQNSANLPFLFTRYANSKLMNAMFIKKLSEIVKDNGVVAHVVHPGFVASDIHAKEDHKVPRFVIKIADFVMKATARSPVQGAMTSVHVAISDEAAETTGKYWDSCKVVAYPNKLITDDNAVDQLWADSLKYLQEKGIEIDH